MATQKEVLEYLYSLTAIELCETDCIALIQEKFICTKGEAEKFVERFMDDLITKKHN